jgi:hypothetical protein
MCFGSDEDLPPAPQIAAPPPVEEFKDFYNFISGSKTVQGVDPVTGKKVIQTMKIPRTAAEEAFWGEVKGTLETAFRNIGEITRRVPQAIPQFMPYINALTQLNQETVRDLDNVAGLPGIENYVKEFRDTSGKWLQESFDKQSEALENNLAQRGLSNSSEADKARKELRQDFNRAIVDNNWSALQYAENLGKQQFDRRMAGFNARQIGRQAMASTAAEQFNLGRQYYADTEAERAARLREQSFMADQSNSLINQDFQKSMSGNTEGHQLNMFSAENQAQMQRYNADADRIYKNYNMQLGEYNANNQPGIGTTLLNIGGMLGGAYIARGGNLFGSTDSGAGAAAGAAATKRRGGL